MRTVWVTDIHLNFVSDAGFHRFIAEVRDAQPDAVLVGGDIGEAKSFAGYLERMAGEVGVPIHFVLGNHDYYQGSILGVRQAARDLSDRCDKLNWLAESDPIMLSEQTALVGHGGWGDARAADLLASDVILNDYLLIEELRQANGDNPLTSRDILTTQLVAALQRLGDEAAAHIRRMLPAALARCDHVIVLMHVPPFREACWHDGHISDDNWAPHFTCVAAGDALLEVANQHPAKQITVLCGHTHSAGFAKISDNLEVFTGDAVYRQPNVQRTIDVV